MIIIVVSSQKHFQMQIFDKDDEEKMAASSDAIGSFIDRDRLKQLHVSHH